MLDFSIFRTSKGTISHTKSIKRVRLLRYIDDKETVSLSSFIINDLMLRLRGLWINNKH